MMLANYNHPLIAFQIFELRGVVVSVLFHVKVGTLVAIVVGERELAFHDEVVDSVLFHVKVGTLVAIVVVQLVGGV